MTVTCECLTNILIFPFFPKNRTCKFFLSSLWYLTSSNLRRIFWYRITYWRSRSWLSNFQCPWVNINGLLLPEALKQFIVHELRFGGLTLVVLSPSSVIHHLFSHAVFKCFLGQLCTIVSSVISTWLRYILASIDIRVCYSFEFIKIVCSRFGLSVCSWIFAQGSHIVTCFRCPAITLPGLRV
jgi:hypothetical protein